MTRSGEARERLSRDAYTTLEPGNPLGLLQEALELAEKYAPMERRLKQAQREGLISADYLGLQIEEAEKAGVISKKEAAELRDYHAKVTALLAVDDFAPEELERTGDAAKTVVHLQLQVAKQSRRKSRPGKRPSRKKAKRKKTSQKSHLDDDTAIRTNL